MQKPIPQMEPWYGDEEKRAVAAYLDSGGWLMEFKKTREFEQMICDYTGAKYCSVVTNGTVSLFIALVALGIKSGDEVIVPDYTMIATPNAVVLAGATPIFVDVDDSLCMDVAQVAAAISPRTKAVMHVSVNGRAGQLDALKKLCDGRQIPLVEDAAQSLGSRYHGKHLGTYGAIGSFSFSVPKIITTGNGGALITNDEALATKIRKIKDFGRVKGGIDIHEEFGWNFKFTDVQAVIGIEQMKKLPWRVERKKAMLRLYQKEFHGIPQVHFIPTDIDEVPPWFIEIVVEKRDALHAHLTAHDIGSRVVYPAIHTQKIYNHVHGNFPHAIHFGEHGLWLPSASQLTDEEIRYIGNTIRTFYG